MTTIALATPADRAKILATVVPAFAKDPVIRHLFPDDDTYPEQAGAFFGDLLDKRIAAGTVWIIEGGNAVAMWESPADQDAPAGHHAGPELPADALRRMRVYNKAVHDLLPAEPYWYLGILATHPAHLGRRLGHTVMTAGLQRAAEAGLPAILETSSEGNLGMYQRAGWELIAESTDPVPFWVLRKDHGL